MSSDSEEESGDEWETDSEEGSDDDSGEVKAEDLVIPRTGLESWLEFQSCFTTV
jgi:hypothetical protein